MLYVPTTCWSILMIQHNLLFGQNALEQVLPRVQVCCVFELESWLQSFPYPAKQPVLLGMWEDEG